MSTEPEKIPATDSLVRSSSEAIDRSAALRNERLEFPPIYVVVGVYRTLSDKNIFIPAWDKCKHALLRGAVVGVGWVRSKFILRKSRSRRTNYRLLSHSMSNEHSWRSSSRSSSSLDILRGLSLIDPNHSSPRVTGLSHDTLFGYKLPFTVTTCNELHSFASQSRFDSE